jgi:hypothetical protein
MIAPGRATKEIVNKTGVNLAIVVSGSLVIEIEFEIEFDSENRQSATTTEAGASL